ncbi:hypothetical protein [Thalassomonas haliotis]|uniref:Uncharacterized protein n=1 Tax=Thalassomonas haliotis TaxID=485448 RepID=A0ABY7VD30_9GAMM|nr:hypothetical protein [Thalassomonas haliotis]WDE11570.1 hypothetical protein H3N35_25765 [Thalassomonas haliotis]
MEKKPFIFSPQEAKDWLRDKQKGKLFYSLISGGKCVGLPIYLLVLTVQYIRLFGFQIANTSTDEWHEFLYIAAPTLGVIALIASYYVGSKVWNKNQENYIKYEEKHN